MTSAAVQIGLFQFFVVSLLLLLPCWPTRMVPPLRTVVLARLWAVVGQALGHRDLQDRRLYCGSLVPSGSVVGWRWRLLDYGRLAIWCGFNYRFTDDSAPAWRRPPLIALLTRLAPGLLPCSTRHGSRSRLHPHRSQIPPDDNRCHPPAHWSPPPPGLFRGPRRLLGAAIAIRHPE